MTIGIVGSRGFDDWELFVKELEKTLADLQVDRIVSGGADGADTMAARYAFERGIPLTVHEARWDLYRAKAGPKRNRLIVADADVIVAFWDGQSSGTRHTIKVANSLMKPVVVITVDPGEGSHEV